MAEVLPAGQVLGAGVHGIEYQLGTLPAGAYLYTTGTATGAATRPLLVH